jgi:hypothetical protein
MNCINIKSKKLVINNHKNDRKGPKKIDLDETFLKYLKPGLDEYLISNLKGESYQSSISFANFFMNTFDFYVYDLRKSISSTIIKEGDIEKIKKMEHIQKIK